MAYHKALDAKPNFTRTWTNLAINYHSQKDLDRSLSFLLNALSLNPSAKHLWSYLESVFIHKREFGKLRLVGTHDISRFADLHNVRKFADLPPPEGMGYQKSFERYAFKGDMGKWLEGHAEKKE